MYLLYSQCLFDVLYRRNTHTTLSHTQKQPLLNALRGYVNRQCRVTLTDGRVVLGSFICYDYLVIHVYVVNTVYHG